jgi:hypothetical protein
MAVGAGDIPSRLKMAIIVEKRSCVPPDISEWIRNRHGSHELVATWLNIKSSRLSQWLSGQRRPAHWQIMRLRFLIDEVVPGLRALQMRKRSERRATYLVREMMPSGLDKAKRQEIQGWIKEHADDLWVERGADALWRSQPLDE